jgi:photosystem II stability/assembly factor-like uncharacterized protein
MCLRPILAWFAAVILAGCAAPAVQTAGGAVVLDQSSVPGEGHVLLRLQAARPASLLNPKWRQLNLRSVARGAITEVYDISSPTAGASLFFARLPEGEYEIEEVASLGPGPGLLLAFMMSDQQTLGNRVGTFRVSPGAVANLGTLVVAQEKDRSARAELLRDALGLQAAREEVELRTGQALILPQSAGWSRAETPAEARAARERARRLVSVLSPGEDAQGAEIMGGTALGQILVRTGGRWIAEGLPTLATLTCARRLADGTLLAGADGGRFFERKPGLAWTAHRLPETDAVVVHIERLAAGGMLVVATTPRETLAYRTDGQGGAAVALARVDSGGALAPVLSTADAIVMVRNSAAFTRESWWTLLDKRTLMPSVRHEKYLVFGFQRLRAGAIAMSRYRGLSHHVSFSPDEGRSWRHGEAESPAWPYFLDEQRGYALDFRRGAFTVESFLVRTTDGGRTWSRTGASMTAELAGRVIGVSAAGEVLVSKGWEVLSTRDEGRTWQRELPSE